MYFDRNKEKEKHEERKEEEKKEKEEKEKGEIEEKGAMRGLVSFPSFLPSFLLSERSTKESVVE